MVVAKLTLVRDLLSCGDLLILVQLRAAGDLLAGYRHHLLCNRVPMVIAIDFLTLIKVIILIITKGP